MEKYKKIRQLGEGSFGTVYLVQDYKKNFYALKKISKMNAFVIDDARK
jgi:serine/threonine protein kinase